MQRKTNIVLDTNIFLNPASYHYFGKTPLSALETFLSLLKDKDNLFCFMPPSIYFEMTKLIEGKIPASFPKLILKKPPSSYQTTLPALFIYEFIDQMRQRTNKGLRIAEKYTRKAIKEQKEEVLIKSLREEYRTGVREGIIDSKADFDLILLSKELGAYLATVDSGLISWATKLGIPCLEAKELKEIISY